MWPIATDVACLCVGQTDVPYKTSWTDRYAIWGLSRVGPSSHVVGVQIRQGEGAIFGSCLTHWKALSHCCSVCSKKSITASARLLQPTALLSTGWCHINYSGDSASCQNSLTRLFILYVYLGQVLSYTIQ